MQCSWDGRRYEGRGILVTVLALAVVAWTGCNEEPNPPTTSVVDSAGVRVVTHDAGSTDAVAAWSLSEASVVDIGAGATPDVPLFRVTAVAPLSRGRAAVGTNTPPQVLILQPDGTLTATLGRRGEGPGEFSAVGSVVPLGADSLAVWDPDRRRMSVFMEDGRFVRDVDLSGLVPHSPFAAPSTAVPAAFTSLLPAGPGTVLVFAKGVWGPGVPQSGPHREELASYRIGTDGARLASYGPFPGMEIYISSEVGMLPFPFGADTHATGSPGAFVVGTGEAPELRVFGDDGELEQIVRWPEGDRTVRGSPLVSDFTAWLDGQIGRRSPGEQAFLRDLINGIPRPELLPAHGDIISGGGGQIWVGEYSGQRGLMGVFPDPSRSPARRWLVFASDGALVAAVRTPEGFQPYAVRDEQVWGVMMDELNTESVRAYRVVEQ
jgi:hypothetical protein